MQRKSAGVRTLLGVSLAALVVGVSTPAAAGTPTPSPSPSGGLPLGVTLGPIHVNLDLPLDLGNLLGAVTPSSSAPPTSSAPSTPAPPSRTLHPSAPPVATSQPARPHPSTAAAAALLPAPRNTPRTRVTATVTTTRTATAARRRVVAGPSLLQSAFEPGNPVMLLGSVVLACALAVGTVVVVGGRRSPRTARHSR